MLVNIIQGKMLQWLKFNFDPTDQSDVIEWRFQ